MTNRERYRRDALYYLEWNTKGFIKEHRKEEKYFKAVELARALLNAVKRSDWKHDRAKILFADLLLEEVLKQVEREGEKLRFQAIFGAPAQMLRDVIEGKITDDEKDD